MNKLTIAILFISSMLIFSCEKEQGNTKPLEHLLTKEKLVSNSIQLIPSKGILIDSDSILIRKTGVADLLSKLDTISIKCTLTVDSPMQIVGTYADSPPPGYTGEYTHRPDEYYTDYSATLQCDSLTFYFFYYSQGQIVLAKNIYMDSLMIASIRIGKPLNAAVFDDLKIGDSYEQIFKYYKKPAYLNQQDPFRKEHKYTGVVFTIETDQSKVENYSKIIAIKINNLME